MNNLKGTWLWIKTADDNSQPEFIEFENDQIVHFKVDKKNEYQLSKIRSDWMERLSDVKHEIISSNRIRIFRMGKKTEFINDTKSITLDFEYATDYERILPTKTTLQPEEIEKVVFKAQWNDEKIRLEFNTSLDSAAMQKIYKRLGQEGNKIVLEQLQGTYFAAIYEDGKRSTLIAIKEISPEKAMLFGFPEKPYEIIAE